jgi:hypothetical protein
MATLGRTTGLALALVVIASVFVGAAGAVDDSKPTATCGLAYKDASGDQANAQAVEGLTDSTEILNGFINYDATKGKDATTFNVTVKNLKAEVPAGATSMSWNSYMDLDDDTRHFVRAIIDFSGEVVYEYGTFQPNPTGVGLSGVSQYNGDTTGKLFEGPEGVIQVVVPEDIAKPGAHLKHVYSASGQGRTLPASGAPQGQRGVSAVADTAPDNGADDQQKFSFTVEPCAGAAPSETPTVTPSETPTGSPTPNPGGPTTLPIKVSGKTKAPKKKSLKVKLKATEQITKLVAQLRKGKKVLGRGKLAKLNKKGTLKLKLTRKAKKGKYLLDLAGNRANGQRGVSTLKLTLK